MSDKRKRYEKEWSFSFENIGQQIRDRISDAVGDVDEATLEEIKFASFSEPVDGREQASVAIKYHVGSLDIRPLVASDNLIEADVNYVGEVEFLVSDPPKYDVVLRQLGNPFTKSPRRAWQTMKKDGEEDKLRWDVRLNPDVPIRLNVDGGVGRSTVDLRGVTLQQLELESGVGSMTIYLPDSDAHYDADIEAGMGSFNVYLPTRANASLDIEGGVGRVTLHVNEGTAVRLSAQIGVGKVDVPSWFELQKRSSHLVGMQGVWETVGYADAEHKVQINLEGGVGKVEVVDINT
jgi:hypothetical protein